eukprot:scaffold32979_cov29-Prasinocladus_malaysianus.AAC.2
MQVKEFTQHLEKCHVVEAAWHRYYSLHCAKKVDTQKVVVYTGDVNAHVWTLHSQPSQRV